MNESDQNCIQMLPPQTNRVTLKSILIDEYVSDSQIDNIDDADPESKLNDQVKKKQGSRKKNKNKKLSKR